MRPFRKILLSFTILAVLLGSCELYLRSFMEKKYGVSEHEISAIITFGETVRKAIDTELTGNNTQSATKDNLGYLEDEEQIKSYFEAFSDNNIGLANSPFDQLINKNNRTIIRDKEGNLKNIGGKSKYIRLLKTKLYNPWDPIIYNSFNENETDPRLQDFVDRFALKAVKQSTDENGYRLTLPKVDAEKIILIIGDSVAYGASIADEKTLASQLQQKYQQVRFINDSIGQGTAPDNRKRLEKWLEERSSDIIGVVYVHTENDYTKNDTPSSIIRPVAALLEKYKIPYRALVHQVYIYQAMPDLFRSNFIVQFGNRTKLKGRDLEEQKRYFRMKNEMLTIAEEHAINTIDFYKIVDDYRYQKGTPFAGFALYVDHCHFSPEGVSLVVDEISKSFEGFLADYF